VLRAWLGEHGDWCPGYQRHAHRAADPTVDHVVPLAAGGAPLDIGNTAVLCRSGVLTLRPCVRPRDCCSLQQSWPTTGWFHARMVEWHPAAWSGTEIAAEIAAEARRLKVVRPRYRAHDVS
jgi:hypothetical protein